MRRNIDETEARRLLTGGPVTILTCSYRGRHNAMPLAYVMPISVIPPMIAVAIHPSRYSFEIVHKTEEFALNIPTRTLMHHLQYLGSLSGEDIDKLELTKLPSFRARRIDTILLEGCVGWIECGLEDQIEMGDHMLLICRVLAASADDEAFSGNWLLTDNDMKPLHYLGGNLYSTLSDLMEARIPKRAEEYERTLQEVVDEQLALSKDESEKRNEEEEQRREFLQREGFSNPPV